MRVPSSLLYTHLSPSPLYPLIYSNTKPYKDWTQKIDSTIWTTRWSRIQWLDKYGNVIQGQYFEKNVQGCLSEAFSSCPGASL